MRYRLRTLLIGQFGLLAVFAVVTLAAIAFAVMRLPAPWEDKLGPLLGLLICYVGLTIRSFPRGPPAPLNRP